MKLSIFLSEAIDILKAKIHKPISLQTVSSNTISIGYEVNVKIPLLGPKSKIISIDLIVDKVVGDDLHFHYSTGIIGADTVINALLSYIPAVNNSKIVDKGDNGQMTLHLKEVEQLGDILEKIAIESVSFERDSILVGFSLREVSN